MATVRSWWLAAALCLLGAGAQAQDDGETAGARDTLARTAMEAQLRLGDLYRQQGRLDEAEAAYREALAIYRRARATPAAEAPAVDVPAPRREGRVLDAPFDAAPGAGPRAVDLGLSWLARHQDEDGRWDCDGFMEHDPGDDRCDGAGGALHDAGVTGLALLAFLGAGYTDRGTQQENPHGRAVRLGLRWLLANQDREGCIGTRSGLHFMYGHAAATLALCEAYALTRNPRYRGPAQQAVDFVQRARNPYLGWRYEPRGGENDTSVTGWCTLALASARRAGLEVDPAAFVGALAWVEKMTDPEFGRVGYNMPGGSPARPEGAVDRFPADKSEAMTATGILVRAIAGQDPYTHEQIRKAADLCLAQPPVWNPAAGTIDMDYWWFGSMALQRVGGSHQRRWNRALIPAALGSQHPADSGARAGSWDPIGVWGAEGGRVYSTALMTLCLELAYRYDKAPGAR